MGRPDPGSGKAEEDVKDVGTVQLHKDKDAGVGGGVKEESCEGLRTGQQGDLDRGEEVGQGGEGLTPLLEGTGKSWCECGTGA